MYLCVSYLDYVKDEFYFVSFCPLFNDDCLRLLKSTTVKTLQYFFFVDFLNWKFLTDLYNIGRFFLAIKRRKYNNTLNVFHFFSCK